MPGCVCQDAHVCVSGALCATVGCVDVGCVTVSWCGVGPVCDCALVGVWALCVTVGDFMSSAWGVSMCVC